MAQRDLIGEIVRGKVGMLKMHLADFSDADMLARPAPNANHAAWQLAHLAKLEVIVTNLVAPGTQLPIPSRMDSAQGKEAAKSDDASRFPTKDELLNLLEVANNAQVAAIAKMTDADFEKPAPDQFKSFAKTMGALLLMGPSHFMMHIGQIQVLRRKLGKPVLF
jgi:hypothetical protein